MARFPGCDAMYQAAARFGDRCLSSERSFLWPDEDVWSTSNVEGLLRAFSSDLRFGGQSFLSEWERRISGCSPAQHKVAADIFAFYNLPIWRGTRRVETRIEQLDRLIAWKLSNDPPDLGFLRDAYDQGVMNPGRGFLNEQPTQLAFCLEWARRLHSEGIPLDELPACKVIAAEVLTRFGATSARNVILHMFFPDQFERIAADEHKREIVEAFKQLVGSEENLDVDDKIPNIRRALEKQYPGQMVDFYAHPAIYAQWNPLGGASDILNAHSLSEPEILNDKGWRENIKPSTRPVLERVQRALGVEAKFFAGGDAAKKRLSFDMLHRSLGRRGDEWNYDGPSAFASIGYQDNPGSAPDLERSLVWGIDGYPKTDSVHLAKIRLQALFPEQKELREVEGMTATPWPGKYLIAFKAIPASELRRRKTDQVVSEIASDMAKIIERVGEQPDGGSGPDGNGEPDGRGLDALAAATFLPVAELTELKLLLEDKKQVILEGPPGAGKTYVSEKFARYFTENALDGKLSNGRLEIVRFHQSYGYEDFVQGIRPKTDGGQISYEVKPGIFGRFCEGARRDPDGRPHVIIIDEINRGNVARIFGELLLALEYRDKEVRLPYADEHEPKFTIPDNVYVIGTMNTTDRSLALLDYALRRRFYFYRLMPVRDGDAPVLRGWLQKHAIGGGDRLLRLFIRLNEEVQRALGPQGIHFQVGHSYFMNQNIGNEEVLERIWKRAVLPLLEEYFYPAKNTAQLSDEFSIERLLSPVVSAPEITAETPDVS